MGELEEPMSSDELKEVVMSDPWLKPFWACDGV
jgi:hypothetical protein